MLRSARSLLIVAFVVAAACQADLHVTTDRFLCSSDDDCIAGFRCDAPLSYCVRTPASPADASAPVDTVPAVEDTSAPEVVDATGDVTPDLEADGIDALAPEVVDTAVDVPPDLEADSVDAQVADTDAPDACVSQCSGKECGPDGCGGTCGMCFGGLTCSAAGGCELKGFVLLNSGGNAEFTMGSPASEPGHWGNEVEHTVTLTHDFWLKATEVTQKEWQDVMKTSPSWFWSCGDDCPVERVSWWDALAYCNARSVNEGLTACYDLSGCSGTAGGGCSSANYCTGDYTCTSTPVQDLGCTGYRLPTEAEWEYAARAGTPGPTWKGGVTYGGDDGFSCNLAPELSAIAWWCGNSDSKTHAVGAANHANPWGLSDMLGNVMEWCWDGYGDYAPPYQDPLGKSGASIRVIRGGSWNNGAAGVRAANRNGVVVPASRSDYFGLRPARSVP